MATPHGQRSVVPKCELAVVNAATPAPTTIRHKQSCIASVAIPIPATPRPMNHNEWTKYGRRPYLSTRIELGTFKSILLTAKELMTVPYCVIVNCKLSLMNGIIGEVTPTDRPVSSMDTESGNSNG